MSHGNLSPRQKMINLMYLVLTALLAMNVSAEVLNAFVLVNESLTKTEKSINAKNADVYTLFSNKYEANKGKVGEWKFKSDRVQKLTKDLITYITDIQKLILVGAGEDWDAYVKDGAGVIEAKDERESPLFTMLEENVEGSNRAMILKAKIKAYSDSIKTILGNGEDAHGIFASMDANLSTEDIIGQDKKPKKWELAYFDQLPLVAVTSMLSKMKTDILNVESDAITYLMTKIEAKTFKFTKVEAFVDAESGYVLQGEEYKARIFIAASDTTQRPVIRMKNGNLLTVDSTTGMGLYTVRTSSPGNFMVEGQIELLVPGSTTEYKPYRFKKEYQVAVPSVSVSPTAMNVFYIGVDNPVEITAAGTPAEKLQVGISAGSISKSGKGYTVKVRAVGNVSITVRADGRVLGTKQFRVKRVPDPVTTVGGDKSNWKGGTMPKTTLLALGGVNATLENFDFNLRFNVTQFDVTCNIGGFDETERANSGNFTTRQKNLIRKAKRNSRVIIENVKASAPGGEVRKLNDVVLKIN